jgi:hypothetical protein
MTWWRRIVWGFRVLVLVIVGLFLHYVLPQHDIVQVTNTYNRLTTVGANSIFYASPDVGTGESATQRDIRFIEAVRPNGKIIVYRNEDTGWVWPPYFKYDSSDLQGEAGLQKSSDAAQKWSVVTHYGWRIRWMSIYPNAVRIKPVDGPDVTIIPWFNIFFFVFLAFIVFMLWRMWAQFRERTVDPLIEDAGEAWDRVDDRADAVADSARGKWTGFRAWLDTWKGKPRR